MTRRRGRWLFLLVLLVGVAGFTGVWYAAAGPDSGSEPKFGGVYIEGVAGSPARINPLYANQNSTDQSLVSLVFAGLTRLDEHGVAFPDLADTWQVSSDGRVYTFTLRQGLLWQDGAPLTTDDVLFTFELLRSPALRSPPPLAKLLANATISRQNNLTLRIELQQPFAPLPAYMTLGILPAHLLQNQGAASMFDAAFNQRPVGSGPYSLQELTPDRA
ncbi:MAG TPA: ABC transporter substrate-binding protein, partial [Dehalococcoidia bacterium]|nr:ABC transporter substrate-binding protein [Dehalococcoidia bacterium]